MPCWMTIQNSVDLGTCDRATLMEALKELGMSPSEVAGSIYITTPYGPAQIKGDTLIMRGSGAANADAAKGLIKQGVMKQAIKKAGAKFGWKAEPIKGTNKIKLRRN